MSAPHSTTHASLAELPRVWVVALLLSALACAALWAITSWGPRAPITSGDGHYVYLAARSIAFDGDLDLSNQYRSLGDRWGLGRWPAEDGTRFPPREIFPSMLMALGLWIGRFLRAPQGLDPLFACTPIAALLGVTYALNVRIESLRHGPRRAEQQAERSAPRWALARDSAADILLVVTLVLLATPLPFYSIVQPAYSHATDAFACTLLVLAMYWWQQHREQPRSRAYLALAMSLCVLTRLQNLLWLACPLSLMLLDARAEPRRQAFAAARAMLLGGALGLGPQLVLALLHPGSATGPIRWGLSFFDLYDLPQDLAIVLLGRNGLLFYNPIVVVALLGLGAAAIARDDACEGSEQRVVARAWLATVLVFVVLMATVRDPDGGASFGARRLCGLTPIWIVGVAMALDRLRGSSPLKGVRSGDSTPRGALDHGESPSHAHDHNGVPVRQHTDRSRRGREHVAENADRSWLVTAFFALLLVAATVNLVQVAAHRAGPAPSAASAHPTETPAELVAP